MMSNREIASKSRNGSLQRSEVPKSLTCDFAVIIALIYWRFGPGPTPDEAPPVHGSH